MDDYVSAGDRFLRRAGWWKNGKLMLDDTR
jgi:hypothetical protein